MKKNLYKELVYKQSVDCVYLHLARQLYFTRKARGLTIKGLSCLSGVPVKTIKRIERSHLAEQTITDLIKLANALDIALEVKFVSIDQGRLRDITEEDYVVKSFTEESENFKVCR